jgi:predicted DCC family thiol-disulfide oxidoreductase YuxK
MQLTLFYDGSCPLCVAEMQALAAFDDKKRLKLVDLGRPEVAECYPGIDRVAAMQILHAELDRGDGTSTEMLLGLDATRWAWKLVNRKPWIAMLRWPLIRPVADLCYLFFARHRYRISYLLTGRKRCEAGVCDIRKEPE